MPRYPAHLRNFSYVGPGRYFLTFCTYRRRPHFTCSRTVDLVCGHFLRTSAAESCAVIAYCFMPDHVHLLVEARSDTADLRRFIKSAKQTSGFYFKQATSEQLWQRFSFEHVLRSDESSAQVARYIVASPISSGITTTPLGYPFWGSFVYSRDALLEYISRDV